jgi:Trypsin-co-occurring domain 2
VSKIVISFDESDEVIREIVARLRREEQPPHSRRKAVALRAGAVVLVIGFLLGYPLLGKFFRGAGAGGGERKLEITELIRDVKRQVVEASAQAEAQGETPFFKLKTVELEINYTVKVSGTSSGKAEFYVLTAENSSQTDLEKAQKIVLHLDAIELYGQTTPAEPLANEEEPEVDVIEHDPPPPLKQGGRKRR